MPARVTGGDRDVQLKRRHLGRSGGSGVRTRLRSTVIASLEWLDRIKAEDEVEKDLNNLLAQSRQRRARALADGIEHLKTAAAVGRLLDPAVTGQAVSKYIRANLKPETSTGTDAEGEAAHAQ